MPRTITEWVIARIAREGYLVVRPMRFCVTMIQAVSGGIGDTPPTHREGAVARRRGACDRDIHRPQSDVAIGIPHLVDYDIFSQLISIGPVPDSAVPGDARVTFFW